MEDAVFDTDFNSVHYNPDEMLIEQLRLQLQDAELRAAKAQGKYEAYEKINNQLINVLFAAPEISMFNMDSDVSH